VLINLISCLLFCCEMGFVSKLRLLDVQSVLSRVLSLQRQALNVTEVVRSVLFVWCSTTATSQRGGQNPKVTQFARIQWSIARFSRKKNESGRVVATTNKVLAASVATLNPISPLSSDGTKGPSKHGSKDGRGPAPHYLFCRGQHLFLLMCQMYFMIPGVVIALGFPG
jgi:hypothetical protein